MSTIVIANEELQVLVSHMTILTPEQVAKEASAMRQQALVMRGYALGLQLPDSVVRTLEQPEAQSNIRLSIFPSPRGVAVLCATLQVEGTQVRTVCNGSDTSVQRWLNGVLSSRCANWLIDIEGAQQVAWISKALQIRDPYRLLMVLHESERLASHHETEEVGVVAAELVELDVVPTLIEGVDVNTLVMAVPFASRGQRYVN